MRQALLKIISIILGLVAAFGIAEVGVRIFCPQEVAPIRFVFDPQRGEIPTPNQQGRQIMPGASISPTAIIPWACAALKNISRRGIRRPPAVFGRFLHLRLGGGGDQTFPYLIEKHLITEKIPVEAINAGNPAGVRTMP